jgi:hypothetical protein
MRVIVHAWSPCSVCLANTVWITLVKIACWLGDVQNSLAVIISDEV